MNATAYNYRPLVPDTTMQGMMIHYRARELKPKPIKFDPAYIEKCHTLEQVLPRESPDLKIARPPNFDRILEVFPTCNRPGVMFAYGMTIYSPWPLMAALPPQIITHESTHMLQQEEAGGADIWWEQYLSSQEYRFLAELDAYRIEQRYLATHASRVVRRRYLKFCAERLSGPLYNHMIRMSDAEQLIKMELT